MILLGLCFKIAAVPFHFYAPDVYEGTTNMNAALLAVVPKIAGIVGLIRILVVATPDDSLFTWRLVGGLAVLTMTLGNVAALWQTNVRRMMAYSSIAHAGYLLVGLTTAMAVADQSGSTVDAVSAMLFYVVVYSAGTLGAFASIAYLSDDDQRYSTLAELAGVGRDYPAIGMTIAVCMLSLTGIPPLAGFWGKFVLIRAALAAALPADGPANGWFVALSIATVLNAAIAAAYYLRLVAAVYFQSSDRTDRMANPVFGNTGAGLVALMSAAIVIGIGLFAGPSLTRTQIMANSAFSQRLTFEPTLGEHAVRATTARLEALEVPAAAE
jgi:NADH-quinone oxidoreductase subunit N